MPHTLAGDYYASMIFLKCILAGSLFLVGFVILFVLGGIVMVSVLVKPPEGTVVGIDPVSMARSYPMLWAMPVLPFLLGCLWEYRRLGSRKAG